MTANDLLQEYNGKKPFTNKDSFTEGTNSRLGSNTIMKEYLHYQLSANDKKRNKFVDTTIIFTSSISSGSLIEKPVYSELRKWRHQ